MVAIVELQPYSSTSSDRLPDRALTWLETRDGEIAIACGRGHMAFLDPQHQIAEDGSIHPSLGCPDEECDWHVMGRLMGYEGLHASR